MQLANRKEAIIQSLSAACHFSGERSDLLLYAQWGNFDWHLDQFRPLDVEK